MKQEVGIVEATPSKRLFLSIIADYDLHRAICELIDNGIDVWIRQHKAKLVQIDVTLNVAQQTISVTDNAGGLRKEELSVIIGPGQSGSGDEDRTIGIFGVGTKRAIVALAQDVRIRTRFATEPTFQIEFDDEWLELQDDWTLPLYKVDNIEEGQTIVSLQRLRKQITERSIDDLRSHLGATYGRFIRDGDIDLRVNGEPVEAIFFDDWSYPPGYEPRHYSGSIPVGNQDSVDVSVMAGLSSESSPATGEYGVYFYCNDRLIARALKNPDVGFLKGFAGLPHPKVSLTKVIVSLSGRPRFLPWNSSKSDIDTKKEVFVSLRGWLMNIVKDYAAISRTWMGDWPDKVFKYDQGKPVKVRVKSFPDATSFLPPLPRARFTKEERVASANKKLAKQKPWTKGIYEGVVSADIIIRKKNLSHRTRIALILLDSTIEIAFKEFLVNDSGTYYSDSQISSLFSSKHKLFSEMKKYINLADWQWGKLTYYADLRNKLIHQRATLGASDDEIDEFRELTSEILAELYGLDVDA
jgi:Molecular chaperone, HSP90 family